MSFLSHSDIIPWTILNCVVFECDRNDWMTVEWSKWGLNEIIRCCLYKRQHLIISFRGHSSVIQTSFHGQSRAYFSVWIPGWRNDGGMTDISEFIFFLLLRKTPHSTSFRHSISLLNDKEWKLQWEDSIQQSFWSFPLHSLIREWCWNDRMRPNEGSFFIQGKTLNSENSLIRLHSVIPS